MISIHSQIFLNCLNNQLLFISIFVQISLLVEKSEFNSLEHPNWDLMDYDIEYERGSESTVVDNDDRQYDSADDDCTTNADYSVASHEDNGSENKYSQYHMNVV